MTVDPRHHQYYCSVLEVLLPPSLLGMSESPQTAWMAGGQESRWSHCACFSLQIQAHEWPVATPHTKSYGTPMAA